MTKKKTEKPLVVNIPNHLNAGTIIDGNITIEGHLRLDGKVKGDVTCSGKLVVGDKGEVLGNIHCQHADIMGSVTGDLEVKGNTTLFSKTTVKGTIYTATINIEPGAVFNGKCVMGTKE